MQWPGGKAIRADEKADAVVLRWKRPPWAEGMAGRPAQHESKKQGESWRPGREEVKEQAAWGFEDRNEMELYSRGDGNPCKFCYWLGIRLIVEKEDPLRNYCRSPVKKGLGPGTKE